MSDIPEWARERAGKLVSAETSDEVCLSKAWTALARYIAEHEEPPVDPIDGAFQSAFCGLGWAFKDKDIRFIRRHLEAVGLKIVPVQS